MKCKRIHRMELAPDAAIWSGAEKKSVEMMATPLAMQPTAYIQKSWADKPYGRIAPIEVAALHDGALFAVRVSWEPLGGGNKDFPDAVAIAMPVLGNPPLALMGTPEEPIHILHWQASKDGKETLRSVVATGIGGSRPGPDIKRQVAVKREGGRIHVVAARALGTGGGAAPVTAGGKARIGFAVWNGGNEERAGIKAFSIDWIDLALDA